MYVHVLSSHIHIAYETKHSHTILKIMHTYKWNALHTQVKHSHTNYRKNYTLIYTYIQLKCSDESYWKAFTHAIKVCSYTWLKTTFILIVYWKPNTHTSEMLLCPYAEALLCLIPWCTFSPDWSSSWQQQCSVTAQLQWFVAGFWWSLLTPIYL